MDFPIPGSPPRSTREPGTIPPPKSLFNSSLLELILGRSNTEISETGMGLATRD